MLRSTLLFISTMSVDSKDNVAVNDNANVAVYENVVININLFQGIPY